MFIPDPGSRIPGPKTATKERGEKIFLSYFFCSSQKYGFGIRDPGSGKNLFRIPDPRVKKAPDPGSGSATLISPVRTGTSSQSRKKGTHREPDNFDVHCEFRKRCWEGSLHLFYADPDEPFSEGSGVLSGSSR
jgi:hypothetical protein